MSKYVKIKVKKFNLNKLKVGDFFEYKDVVYKFLGYEYDLSNRRKCRNRRNGYFATLLGKVTYNVLQLHVCCVKI